MAFPTLVGCFVGCVFHNWRLALSSSLSWDTAEQTSWVAAKAHGEFCNICAKSEHMLCDRCTIYHNIFRVQLYHLCGACSGSPQYVCHPHATLNQPQTKMFVTHMLVCKTTWLVSTYVVMLAKLSFVLRSQVIIKAPRLLQPLGLQWSKEREGSKENENEDDERHAGQTVEQRLESSIKTYSSGALQQESWT